MKIKKNHEFLKENKNNLNINLILQVLIEMHLILQVLKEIDFKKIIKKTD